MVIVDSSVWIDVLRNPRSRYSAELRLLIDEDRAALTSVTRAELLIGVHRASQQRLQRWLDDLPCHYPQRSTWDALEEMMGRAKRRGFVFSVPDLLIAAIATEESAAVWSLDKDFTGMERLGLVRLFG